MRGIQAPQDEFRPFEGFADYIEQICRNYPSLIIVDKLIIYFYFWHRQGENGGILSEPFNEREKRILSEAKDFMFLLITDITREKCMEKPMFPIDSQRLQIAREHAAKLRNIVQDFSIKY